MPTAVSDQQRTDAALIAALVREADPVFAFQPMPQQTAILKSEAPVVMVFGGNRPGKSDLGSYWVATRFLTQPQKKVWCVTVDEPLSVRVQQAKIHGMIPRALRVPLPDSPRSFYYNYSPQTGYVNNKFVLNNGTQCEFKFYSQEVKSFQGHDLDGIWYDEIPPKAHYDESSVRLWDRGGRVLVTGTATEGITPFIKEVISNSTTVLTRYAPLVHKNLPVQQIARHANAEIFYLWTTDNRYIDQEAVKRQCRAFSQTELELRIYGVPSNLQGLVYPQYNHAIHVRPTPPYAPHPPTMLLHALDPHDRKPWCMGWYIYLPRLSTLHTVAEYPDFLLKERDTPAGYSISDYVRFVRLIEEQLGWADLHVHRIIDPNKGNTTVVGTDYSEKIIHLLSRKGLYYTSGHDSVVEGHMEVRDLLSYDISEPISEKNQPRLYFSPACKNHTYQFQNYEFSDHASEQREEDEGPRETPKGANKDFPDLVRYVAMFLRTHTQPPESSSKKSHSSRRRTLL